MAAKRLPDEAAEGAALAAVNSVALLGDADLLADAGRYGCAVSLVVLAFEESVKAEHVGGYRDMRLAGHEPARS
jgi:AbiV family abortive infection protein